ncbi:MAG TPA: IclR family transcriptional regulator [Bosea sp. (in: a-proteobacteria)]|jgi:DNA-binding IclR family transcriptional regulator|uniref:IclR family transcriptional regulator n=1 Tax=Bosea sp. (in: a-proteobacteria) TaxID=1871050 RepID=UPI002E12B8E4|nr:IclR family transcriptional regulator [Bosea sp. (in: a-proteobacteria)]
MAQIPAERCLSIVQLLVEEAGEMQLGEIALRLGLPKSGVHRLLGALIEQGWVEQDPQTSAYRLTMRLTILGQRLYNATGIPDICQPVLDELAAQTREFVRLAVIDAYALVWVADAQGARGGLMYQPLLTTNTVPLHATASGKSWLARLPRTQVREIIGLNGGFGEPGQYGPNAVRSFEQLFIELERTAARGYGVAVSEAEPGVTAVAAAICSGVDGAPVGTVSVAGPGVRMSDARVSELGALVIDVARQLSELWPLRKKLKRPGRVSAAA